MTMTYHGTNGGGYSVNTMNMNSPVSPYGSSNRSDGYSTLPAGGRVGYSSHHHAILQQAAGLHSPGAGVAIEDGVYVDGSWELRVFVEDLNIDKKIRVKGDLHIGGVMHRLVESIAMKMDWSDHALWWPDKSRWLLKTRSTLDQCGVQADVQLEFRRMNNFLTIQLPDLQERTLRVNFAKRVFAVVVQLCKELGIRHPEELSLSRALEKDDLRRNNRVGSIRRRRPGSQSTPTSPSRLSVEGGAFNPFIPKSPGFNTLGPQSPQSPRTPGSPGMYGTLNGAQSTNLLSPCSVNSLAFEGADETILANTPHISAQEAFEERKLCRLKTLTQKARTNVAWLDSSRTLMEQGVEPSEDRVLLRFKYFSFYDLNPKYDAIRINQLFEQAKWSIISEEMECTEEESMLLAGLQFQAQLQLQTNEPGDETDDCAAEDEIDAALAELELSLTSDCLDKSGGGLAGGGSPVYHVPKLTGVLKFFKPKKFTLKNYKKYFFVLQDTTLSMFKGESHMLEKPMEQFSLRNTEVISDVNLTTQKLGIKLFVHANNGVMQEIWLRCEDRDQYAKWMAACNLASRGKTMASLQQYDAEVKATLHHLDLQAPKAQPEFNVDNMPKIDPQDFVPARFLKKMRTRQVLTKILERHANIRDKNLIDAKLEYIKTWQRLPGHGVSYFVGRFNKMKKEELLGIAYNRMMRLDATTSEVLNTWRYREMQSWTVNWEVKQMVMEFDRETVSFQSLSAPCKTVHEFIGGYVFLNMRTPEKSQELNEEFFHKLTGGNTS